MEASLEEFTRTGRFGTVELGMTRLAVEQYLGSPDDWFGNGNYQSAEIWKYGDIEFYFQNDTLWMIFMDDFTVPKGGEKIQLDAWIVNGALTVAETESMLLAAAIPFVRQEFPYSDNGMRLVTAAKTTFSFSGEDLFRVKLDAVLCQIDPTS